ncbi:MAG TPA: hypothetical protein VGS10_08480 [Terracidiphilus sp.]|nr:hypothetical protein [Terracidiphilus sp.]
MSNLTRELQTIEREHKKAGGAALAQARSAVVKVISDYRNSRFQLGRVLRNYQIQFKEERGWVVAAKAIAEAINRDERTIYRIIGDFERASNLAPIWVETLHAQKLVPAAPKNAGIVEEHSDTRA